MLRTWRAPNGLWIVTLGYDVQRDVSGLHVLARPLAERAPNGSFYEIDLHVGWTGRWGGDPIATLALAPPLRNGSKIEFVGLKAGATPAVTGHNPRRKEQ